MTPQRTDSGPVSVTRLRAPLILSVGILVSAVSATAGAVGVAFSRDRDVDDRIDKAVARSRTEIEALQAVRYIALREQLDRIENRLDEMRKP